MAEETKYETAAETAKKIRVALKAKFPSVKFSVRSDSYSMGSSVRVAWTDGPTAKQVEAIAQPHENVHRDDASGEILSGGNRYIFCNRELSDRVQAYARSQIPVNLSNDYERDTWTYRIAQCVEVRPCGQLLEWSR
jgi:hypothetical protein